MDKLNSEREKILNKNDFERKALGELIEKSLPISSKFDNYKIPLPQEINICYRDAKNWRQPIDPLMLDLDGDGLELKPADGSILFDHDADGIKTGTGWIGADDGILVRDLNGDGKIATGRELFGTETLKSNGQKAKDGFDALADLDSNHDGNFTSADAAWSQVKVWRDLNQNGVTDTGELFGLD